MLSIENPSPSDPHENSLKGVDLSNPALDDHNPIPKFSIRDYVFNSRGKDIETNWPFSPKSLQLCLRHGVKDLLPPFQCSGCVKNWPSERDVESSLIEEGRVQILIGNPSNLSNDLINSSPNEVGNIGSSELESDKQLPFITNTPSHKEVLIKSSEKLGLHLPKKTDIPKPLSMKKCKLIVKVGTSGVEPSSNINTASMMAAAMAASKVCPVCKTFSSPSNTTLNAHIDQCLSVDSPIEPSSKSRVIRHKIKPGKVRLMADIYANALHCTLEELDRRNGRIWSEEPILMATQETMKDCGEEKRQRSCFEEKDDKDTVYIDANGTKLRILNKISDTSSVSKVGVNPCRLTKALKGDKGSKSLPTYKKQKHRKYLKLASQREKQSSYKTRLASRVLGNQENLSVKENLKTDENMDTNMAPSSKARGQIKALDSETIMPKWASSKRTDLLKRRCEIDQTSSCNMYLERSYGKKVRNCYESPHLSPQKSKGMDNSSSESPTNECHEQPPLKKQTIFKLSRAHSASVNGTFSSKATKFSSSREQMFDQSSSRQPKLSNKSLFCVKNVESRDFNEKHLEHQYRVDVGCSQLSRKRSNILKIQKKKSPVIISPRKESTEDCNSAEIYSSPRAVANVEDGFVNVERPRDEEIIFGQSSRAADGNFTSLGKSFDHDFYRISDSNMDMEMGPNNEQENCFSGVDTIPIPGPPGSFLQSPGRMSSDEDHQGNSSVTTSLAQSSVDLDMVDRDSSNSPKSANSTVSNTLLTNSDPRSAENLSFNPSVPQDEIVNLDFSGEITKRTLGFQDGQPCCCSRKEAVSVNIQESQLLRRRDPPSSPSSKVEKPLSFYPKERYKDMIDLESSSVYPISDSGKGPTPIKVPVGPPVYGDFGSPSPSSPNPVLRLMGKNLMVVNNEENLNQSPNSKFQAGTLDHVVRQVTPFYGYKAMDLDLHEHKPDFAGLLNNLNRSRNSPFSPLGYNKIDRVEASLVTIQRNEGSIIPKDGKEVIVIDDSPENEVQTSSADISIPMAGYYAPSHLNPFYSNQGYEFSPYRDPHVIPNVSSQIPPPSLGPMRWNSVLDGSNILTPSSLTSLSPINCSRSSLYYPPSTS